MILLTGGSGLLGTELQKYLKCEAPSHAEFDILDPIFPFAPSLIVHCAAYTDVLKAEEERDYCFAVNANGTANMAEFPLVYISTEYVFDGRKGNYKETDAVGPVNAYAESKLLGEEEAAKAPRHLIIRTLFKPRPFEHPRALVDQWTSGDYVDVIAPLIARAVKLFVAGRLRGVIHIGTGRKRIYDLAKQSRDVTPLKRRELPLKLPKDTSLDCSLWESLSGH